MRENSWKDKYLNDTRTTQELIDLALKEDDEDSDARWDLINILRYRGSNEVFESASKLCESNITKERILGVDILAQLGSPDRTFLEESLPILFNLLSTEQAADVLRSVAFALGHLGDTRAVEHLIKLKNHPDEDVRYGVVFGLLTHEDERAISALIELSKDVDEDVRDWATFGIGTQIDVDTPEIREALFERLSETGSETCDDIRGEALVGLARRKDERVLEPLLKDLESEDAGSLILEAAEEFADPRLMPSLLRLKDIWGKNYDVSEHINLYLRSAIEACQNKTE